MDAGQPNCSGEGTGNGPYILKGTPFAHPLAANPIVSRGKPLQSPQASAPYAFDGSYNGSPWDATPGADAWVAVNVGAGPSKLLLVWHNAGNPDYENSGYNYGSP